MSDREWCSIAHYIVSKIFDNLIWNYYVTLSCTSPTMLLPTRIKILSDKVENKPSGVTDAGSINASSPR